jgi:flagellar biosynthesis protein FlhF
MKLKSYFSASVEAAMELARRELGEEALLVNARPATPETRYLGAYEVVFGLVPENPDPPPSAKAAAIPPEPAGLQDELTDLRRQVERLTRAFEAPPATPLVAQAIPVAAPVLRDQLDPVLAERIARGARLDELFHTDSHLGRRRPSGNSAGTIETRSIVALVGPPGVGKTLTLAKLAARYGLAARRPVQILTADVERIAATEQLRTLAAILGIGCDVAETPLALLQLLEEHRSKGLILIDTPGFSYREMADAQPLAAALSTHPEIDTHLVLSAAMKPADLTRVGDAYAIFRPSKLLFTRIDETTRYEAIVNESARRNLPVSFLGRGQQIPDDLEEATPSRLLALIDLELTPEIAPLRMRAAA